MSSAVPATEDRAPGLAARRAALAAISAVDERGAYSTLVVPAAVADLSEERDRALASHLAYDTLRWQGTLEWVLRQVVERELDRVEPPLRRILLLGALQLLRTDVPAHAAVATSVALARASVPTRRADGAAGFVNGVLRALDRSRGGLPWPDDPVERLALETAHPPWMVADLTELLGEQEARAALEAENRPPGVTFRATGDRDALVDELVAAGVDAHAGRHAPEAVTAGNVDPRRLAAVSEGRAVPQDEASMMVVHATGTRPGDQVLDLCSGPGGKATHLAALAGLEGRVVGLELHPQRARLVREVAQRVGVRVEVIAGDGTHPPVRGPFDVVLVDAPCTALGTGRRRPEVRWRRSPADVRALAEIQTRLVRSGIRLLRPGGRLTYSACTWTRGETTGVVARLRAEGDVELLAERSWWPHRDGTDGMYVATLRRGAGRPTGSTAEPREVAVVARPDVVP